MDFIQATVSEINKALEDPIKFVADCEADYRSEIKKTAAHIAADDRIKIVALAGPSGAGKTTTAHILCDELIKQGEIPVVVSLDDFFLSYKDLPLLPDGSPDTESARALNMDLLNECFTDIITTGKTLLPRYDFTAKLSIREGREVDITNKGIVIVEGLHALNPLITELVPKENLFKIYISVNYSIFDDEGNKLLSSRQIRLMRRIIRDLEFRGKSVSETLHMWKSVVEGEEKFLYCFKETAQVFIKTLHRYEPCLYRNEIRELFKEASPADPCYEYFEKTARALEGFSSMSPEIIPNDSLIREFIGEGKYNKQHS